MTDRQTLDVYDARAQDYLQALGSLAKPDVQRESFLKHLPPAANVLDLGCGPGRSAAIIAAAGHKVTATDASVEMVKLAGQHPGVTARQESFDDLKTCAIYDGIWANFSLLHAQENDLPHHLAAIATALKPGGLFHIGMKTGTGTKRDSIGRRYTYVTRDGLAQLLYDAGLHPFAEWTGEDTGLDGTIAPWIVMQARKDD